MDNSPKYRLGDNNTSMIDTFRSLPLKYEDPCPLADGATGRGAGKYFLCARTMVDQRHPLAADGSEQTGIFLLDVFGNEILLHAEERAASTRCHWPRGPGRR